LNSDRVAEILTVNVILGNCDAAVVTGGVVEGGRGVAGVCIIIVEMFVAFDVNGISEFSLIMGLKG
jgi:hypothetical protein